MFHTPRDQGLRWLSEELRYHDFNGVVRNIINYGTLKSLQDGGEPTMAPVPSGGYVKIQRQGDAINFYLANKRPAFTRMEVFEALTVLRETMQELGVVGQNWIKYFEVRNSRNIVINRFRGMIEIELVEGVTARAYQDKDQLQTEFRLSKEMNIGELVSCINSMWIYADSLNASKLLEKSVRQTNSMVGSIDRQTVRNYNLNQELNSNLTYEIKDSLDNITSANEGVQSELLLVQETLQNTIEQVSEVPQQNLVMLTNAIAELASTVADQNKLLQEQLDKKGWRRLAFWK